MFNTIVDSLNDFVLGHLLQVVLIVVGVFIVERLFRLVIGRVVRRTVRATRYKTTKDEKQREDTIISILSTASKVVLFTLAVFMLLSEFGIDIGPLLAGAGIAGVALGFGAQSMVKDYLAGIFIVAENQYRVGDVLQVNQTVAGVVERISLRATVLRDLDGVVHYVPNGFIDIATNMTMEFANVDLNIGVAYDTDIDHLEQVINRVGEEIFADEDWQGVVLEAPHMLRVDKFADSAIMVKVVCKTAPIRQWEVKSLILRRLKKAFDKEGIVIPFPQRVIHQAAADAPKTAKHATRK